MNKHLKLKKLKDIRGSCVGDREGPGDVSADQAGSPGLGGPGGGPEEGGGDEGGGAAQKGAEGLPSGLHEGQESEGSIGDVISIVSKSNC